MRLLESKSVIALVSFRKPIGALRFAAGFFGLTLLLLSASSAVEAASEEEICRNSVQGRVAWHQNGNTSWEAASIAMLCQGTQNSAARISCFQTEIQTGLSWRNAIANCKAREQGPQAKAPVQGQASLNAQQIGAVLYTPVIDPATKKLLAQVAPNEWRDVTNPGTSGQTIIRLEEVFRNDFEIRLVEPNCGMHVSIYTANAGSTNLARAVTLARPNEEPARLGHVARYVRLSELPQSIPPDELRRMAAAPPITNCSLITASLPEGQEPSKPPAAPAPGEQACIGQAVQRGLDNNRAAALCAGAQEASLPIACFESAVKVFGAGSDEAIGFCRFNPSSCSYQVFAQARDGNLGIKWVQSVGFCHFPDQLDARLAEAREAERREAEAAAQTAVEHACTTLVMTKGLQRDPNDPTDQGWPMDEARQLCAGTPKKEWPIGCFSATVVRYRGTMEQAMQFCRFDQSACAYQAFSEGSDKDIELRWVDAVGRCHFPNLHHKRTNELRLIKRLKLNDGRLSFQYPQKWMAQIRDDVRLNRINIPGAHDSGADYGCPTNFFSRYAKTQDLSVRQQLDIGVRYLDMRLRSHGGDQFEIWHGMCFQEKYFKDVLTDIANFLNKNPSETILMRVKNEWSDDANFGELFTTYMEAHPGLFYPSDTDTIANANTETNFERIINQTDQLPTLGEVRGRIVIILNSDQLDRGIVYGSVSKDGQSLANGVVTRQDQYHLQEVDAKWNDYVHPFLLGNSNTLRINHTGATELSSDAGDAIQGFFATANSPRDFADALHGHLRDFLWDSTGYFGVIDMDFVDASMTRAVVQSNDPVILKP